MKTSSRTHTFWAPCIVAGVLLAGCGSGDRTLDQVDPVAVSANPSFDQVFSIIQRECTPCHDSQSPALITCEDVVANALRIKQQVLTDNSMPPGAWPRLTSEEKLVIERWINNGTVAPCF